MDASSKFDWSSLSNRALSFHTKDKMDEMEALMGFSAFGGGATSRCGQRRKPKLQQLTNLGANTPQRSPAQVVPGTELGEQLQRAGDSKRLEHGAHGVTFLLSGSKGGDAQDTFGAESLGSLLCSPRTESGDDRREAATAKLLPARCYTLLDELQQEKNKCVLLIGESPLCEANARLCGWLSRRFDALDSTTFRRARSAANPYEPLGRGPFLNRSAMKVVNMDHMFQLTAVAAAAASANTSPFTFADVCGGPGGFSEYLLSRAPPRASHSAAPNQQSSIAVCGYGISLKDEICDWKLPPSSHSDPDTCESPEVDTTASFEISYGADGTGNLYELSNIRHFRDRVVLKNHPQGVHLVVADGGFQDARDQRDQEQMMTRLVVAEVLTMFSVLRAHGSFVCKTFELATPMMLQLVWLLHQCFEKITVVKPVVS